MVTAWDMMREYKWLLKRFGLEEVAKRTPVEFGWLKEETGVFTGNKIILNEELPWYMVPETILHELIHAAGLKEPAAQYASARAEHMLKRWGEYYPFPVREYRKEALKYISKALRGIYALLVGQLIPIPLLIHYGPPALIAHAILWGYLISLMGQKIVQLKRFEEVPYVRWLLKRGVKRKLEMSGKDATRFIKGREEVLRAKELLGKMPNNMYRKLLPEILDPRVLIQVIPLIQDKRVREIVWRIVLQELARSSRKRYRKVLLAGVPHLPPWFFRPVREGEG